MSTPPAERAASAPSAGGLLLGSGVAAVGIFWLMAVLGDPDAGWIWALALAAAGSAVFLVHRRIDKWTVVAGPFLLLAAAGSVLRQAGWLLIKVELPLLVIALGLLILLAQHRRVPMPRWYGPGC